jgi:hypothetical protein
VKSCWSRTAERVEGSRRRAYCDAHVTSSWIVHPRMVYIWVSSSFGYGYEKLRIGDYLAHLRLERRFWVFVILDVLGICLGTNAYFAHRILWARAERSMNHVVTISPRTTKSSFNETSKPHRLYQVIYSHTHDQREYTRILSNLHFDRAA